MGWNANQSLCALHSIVGDSESESEFNRAIFQKENPAWSSKRGLLFFD